MYVYMYIYIYMCVYIHMCIYIYTHRIWLCLCLKMLIPHNFWALGNGVSPVDGVAPITMGWSDQQRSLGYTAGC